MAAKISFDCINCGHCAARCPTRAIHRGEETYVVDPALCTGCGMCVMTCPVGAAQLHEDA